MSKMKELQDAMIAAMKAKDKFRKDAISVLVSAAKKSGIDAGCREDIPDDMVNTAILKELKSCKEQIDTCPESREDLLEEYKKRYEIMSEFAPKMLSAERASEKDRFSEGCRGDQGILAGEVCRRDRHRQQGTDHEGCHG